MSVGFKFVSVFLLTLICLPAIAADKYVFVAGAAFSPRSSTQTLTYEGAGCAYTNAAITTSLQLPQGATIKEVRLYYYNQDSSKKLDVYLTRYKQDGTFDDLLWQQSSLSGGYRSQNFQLSPHAVVNNQQFSYVLTSTMTTTPDSGDRPQLCGVRVKYSAP